MNNLIFLVPLFPLLGFLINGLFRKSLSKSAISVIGSGVFFYHLLSASFYFLMLRSNGGTIVIIISTLLMLRVFKIPFAFQVDQLSVIFLLIITGVGFLIHLYSTSYMHEEPTDHFGRYFSYLNLVRVLHVVACDGSELCNHVYRLGRRGTMFLFIDRFLV